MRTVAVLTILAVVGCSTADDGPDLVGGSDAVGGQGGSGPGGSGPGGGTPDLNQQLRDLLATLDPPLTPLQPVPPPDATLVALGEALFFDPILSGNKDVSCASCHHPAFATGDGLSLSVGTGATGIGPDRAKPGYPGFIPRHAKTLFNVGDPGFERLYWDGRVERLSNGSLRTPLGIDPLAGLQSPLAAQALIPVLDRAEMRGQSGDTAVTGESNELAVIADDDFAAALSAVMARLEAIDGYQTLFEAAFGPGPWTFADAANALAAYQTATFATQPTVWDAYVAGDDGAINEAAKLGALLFYGGLGCGNCHSGPLLTDHVFHNIGVVQLGPGFGDAAPFDLGRQGVTGDTQDRFAFRTPSLRNVMATAPYMHNGAYPDISAVLSHYGAPLDGHASYDAGWLHEDLVQTVQTSPAHVADITGVLSDEIVTTPQFAGFSNVREFLEALTDPSIGELVDAVPDQTVSGLPLQAE